MKRVPVIVWFVLFSIILFWNLGALNVTIMEARNFVTAREMVNDGSYLIPTLNGEYRLQKPPLPTWMTATMILLTGSLSEFWLRIPAVFLALIGILFSMKIVRLTSDKSIDANMTGAVLVTSFYFFWTARSGMWDIFAQGFTVMAIYYYMQLMKTKQVCYRYGIFVGLSLAASFMSKGPVALYGLFLPFLCAFHLLNRKQDVWNALKLKGLGLGVLIAIVVGASWPCFIYFSEAATAAVEIAQVEAENWSNYNVKPFYHYWSFPVQSGIWTVFGFFGIIGYIICYKQMKENKAARFYFWWTLLVILFLSLIPEKKERYLLPVLFPLAMFLTEIVQTTKPRFLKLAMKGASVLTILTLIIASVVLIFGLRHEIVEIQYRILGGLTLLISALAALFFIIKEQLSRSVYAIAFSFAAMVIIFLSSASELLNSTEAINSFRQIQDDEELRTLPLVSTSASRPELIWYIGRKAVVVDDDQFPIDGDRLGVLSFRGIEKELDSGVLQHWNIVSEELYDQNPKVNSKKPNIALKRYFAVLEKK